MTKPITPDTNDGLDDKLREILKDFYYSEAKAPDEQIAQIKSIVLDTFMGLLNELDLYGESTEFALVRKAITERLKP